jgi:hypothetical protein
MGYPETITKVNHRWRMGLRSCGTRQVLGRELGPNGSTGFKPVDLLGAELQAPWLMPFATRIEPVATLRKLGHNISAPPAGEATIS